MQKRVQRVYEQRFLKRRLTLRHGDKKNIVISPVNPLALNKEYTVKIPRISDEKGNTISNLVVKFVAKNTLDDLENAVDLEDIIASRYPQLEGLEKENPEYNLGHELNGNTLILTLLLTPKRDISLSDEESDQVLVNLNQKILQNIRSSGMNLQTVDLRYENAHQSDLLYQDSIRFLKQDQIGG